MHILPAIVKITSWAFMHALTKYICLIFLLFAVVAYPYQTLAADATNKQTKPIGGNETITGAFGIKFGEDIKPYLEGHYANLSMSTTGLNDIPSKTFTYKILKPPINLKQMFPDVRTQLLGIADDNDRVIRLRLMMGEVKSCKQSISSTAIKQTLEEKYKITKFFDNSNGWVADYGDSEGNIIETRCESDRFDATFTSHLMPDYIKRLEAAQQKQKEDIKNTLKNIM